jgi:PAS domain S-box-containing protein
MIANPMASRMTGLTAEELCGRTLEGLHPAEEWPQVAERYQAGFSAGNLAPFECRIRTLDGGELLASVTGTRYDLDGKEVEMLEYQDVTESRRVEEALRNAEERLRSVVANAPVVLFAIDEHGTFTLSEGQGLAALGLRPGQVVGCSAFELYAQHPQILANFRRAMAGESFMDRVDVGDLSFETWYAPTRGPDGRPQGVIGVSNDVSRRRHLEDQLRQAQKMEAIGRLAGGVAHDFNNLLAAIMGHGELLLRRLEPNQPQHRHAEAIQKAAARGALLTRQLLAFSRKEVAGAECARHSPGGGRDGGNAAPADRRAHRAGDRAGRGAGARAGRPWPARAGDHEPRGQRSRRDGGGRSAHRRGGDRRSRAGSGGRTRGGRPLRHHRRDRHRMRHG